VAHSSIRGLTRGPQLNSRLYPGPAARLEAQPKTQPKAQDSSQIPPDVEFNQENVHTEAVAWGTEGYCGVGNCPDKEKTKKKWHKYLRQHQLRMHGVRKREKAQTQQGKELLAKTPTLLDEAKVLRHQAFKEEALQDLHNRTYNIKRNLKNSHGFITNDRVRRLLPKALLPGMDSAGKVEAIFCTVEKSFELVKSTIDVPIIFPGKKESIWNDNERPIQQLFNTWLIDKKKKISVQIPSRDRTRDTFAIKKLKEVQDKFIPNTRSDDPYNILDLSNPLPDILPPCIRDINCQLLHQIQYNSLQIDWAQRDASSPSEARRFKNVLEGLLLCEGGYWTWYHTDSKGFSTFIKSQEGVTLIVFLANPTDDEWDSWAHDDSQDNGRIRFVILEPGDTILLPSGCIHLVGRCQQTLNTTGHFLQWTGIDVWLKILRKQWLKRWTTNEEMRDDSVLELLGNALKLIELKIGDNQVEIMGGMEIAHNNAQKIKVRVRPGERAKVANPMTGFGRRNPS
jgi:hypothetical protein